MTADHGFPQFRCRRCRGDDRSDPVASSGLASQVNPDREEQIDVAEQRTFDTGAAGGEGARPAGRIGRQKTAGDTGGCQSGTPRPVVLIEEGSANDRRATSNREDRRAARRRRAGRPGALPGPGHSAGDRSLSVKPDPADREGFVTHSFAGDDWKACRDHVRTKLGLPDPKSEPQQKTNGGKAAWTVLGEYIYCDQNGERFLKVRKCRDETGKKQFPQYHWDGTGWAKGKPDGPKIPYRLPQLIAAPNTALVYFCEGEKDADALAKIGFVATTASEGAAAKWDPALTLYFKDRHVVILPDADLPGRAHAQKVAKAIHGVAAVGARRRSFS